MYKYLNHCTNTYEFLTNSVVLDFVNNCVNKSKIKVYLVNDKLLLIRTYCCSVRGLQRSISEEFVYFLSIFVCLRKSGKRGNLKRQILPVYQYNF